MHSRKQTRLDQGQHEPSASQSIHYLAHANRFDRYAGLTLGTDNPLHENLRLSLRKEREVSACMSGELPELNKETRLSSPVEALTPIIAEVASSDLANLALRVIEPTAWALLPVDNTP